MRLAGLVRWAYLLRVLCDGGRALDGRRQAGDTTRTLVLRVVDLFDACGTDTRCDGSISKSTRDIILILAGWYPPAGKKQRAPVAGGLGRLSAHKNSHEIRIILIILIWILLSLSLMGRGGPSITNRWFGFCSLSCVLLYA